MPGAAWCTRWSPGWRSTAELDRRRQRQVALPVQIEKELWKCFLFDLLTDSLTNKFSILRNRERLLKCGLLCYKISNYFQILEMWKVQSSGFTWTWFCVISNDNGWLLPETEAFDRWSRCPRPRWCSTPELWRHRSESGK